MKKQRDEVADYPILSEAELQRKLNYIWNHSGKSDAAQKERVGVSAYVDLIYSNSRARNKVKCRKAPTRAKGRSGRRKGVQHGR